MRAFDNFTERVVRLEDVLFLPDCARKLVSQSKLDRAGAMIITHRGVCSTARRYSWRCSGTYTLLTSAWPEIA